MPAPRQHHHTLHAAASCPHTPKAAPAAPAAPPPSQHPSPPPLHWSYTAAGWAPGHQHGTDQLLGAAAFPAAAHLQLLLRLLCWGQANARWERTPCCHLETCWHLWAVEGRHTAVQDSRAAAGSSLSCLGTAAE